VRQDLQIDASLIHLADAQRAEIIEPLDDVGTRAGTRTELLDLRVLVMFFERDDVGLLCHFYPPSYASVPAVARRVNGCQRELQRLRNRYFRVVDCRKEEDTAVQSTSATYLPRTAL
jgi:hypothetical protein